MTQPGNRIGPLLQAERPWEEGAGIALTTIIKDGGMYRGWGGPFTTSGDPPGQNIFTISNRATVWRGSGRTSASWM